jgi:hypothetical protein
VLGEVLGDTAGASSDILTRLRPFFLLALVTSVAEDATIGETALSVDGGDIDEVGAFGTEVGTASPLVADLPPFFLLPLLLPDAAL